MKLTEIIKKNLKVIARSRSSAMIVFLGPLLIILLVGFAFSNSQSFSLRIGAYSESYSELSNSMMKQLTENNYQVRKFADERECVDAIKEGTVNACIIFPPGMKVSENANELIFHIDYSKLNLVYILIDSMTQKIAATSSEISLDLTTDLLNKLNFAQAESKNNIITITELIDEKKNLERKVAGMDAQIRSMDTAFDSGSFYQNDINKNLGLIKEGFTKLNGQLGRLTDAKETIEPVKSKLKDTAFNNESLALERAIGTIDDAKKNLSSIITLTDVRVVNLSATVGLLDSALERTKKQLETAERTKSYSEDAIADMKKTITNIEIKIGDLRKSMNDVDSRISGIAVREASAIVAPIKTRVEPIVVEKSHFNYIFPTLIVLVIMTTAILFSSISTVVERNGKAYFRNSIAPVPKYLFEVGQFLAALLMIAIQLAIFSVFAAIFFKQNFLASVGTTALSLVMISALFILIGMLAGNIFNTEETAILAAITLSSLFLFLSNTVLPLETLPEFIKGIAQFNPFVISESLLRQTILYLYRILGCRFSFSSISSCLR